MKALLIVDPNIDFFPGGALGVPEGDKILKPLNLMIVYARVRQWPIIVSRDWHPAVMPVHFAKWPPHCVQSTMGAEFHPALNIATAGAIIVSKGMRPDEDAYSPFEGFDGDGRTLCQVLQAHGINHIYFGGLATDYCVKAAGIDGVRLGFQMHLLIDASRGVNIHPGDDTAAITEMIRVGVKVTSVEAVIRRP